MKQQRVITGLQPTGLGELHLGNYCGPIYSIKKAIESGDFHKENIYIFSADLHSMTVKHTNLREKSINIIKSLYVFDLSDNLYIQSDVGVVCEGLWLLSQFTTTGEMNRMTQFKDKQDMAGSTIGLYTYPVLMAADVLFMNGNYVPVGEDQTQHMEVVRDIGEKVNVFAKKNIMVIPEMYVFKNSIRIMSLNDITKKMSKSYPDGCIFLTDEEVTVRSKVKKAQTDALPFPSHMNELPNRPAAENLINIYAIIDNRSIDSVINEFKGVQWSFFKDKLGDLLVSFNKDFQDKFKSIDEEKILNLLINNKNKVKEEMTKKIQEVSKIFM